MKKKLVMAVMALAMSCAAMTVGTTEVKAAEDGLNMIGDQWYYTVNGEVDKSKNGFIEYEDGLFFVSQGRVVTEKNGLTQDPANPEDWYYLANGQAQLDYTGLAEYDGEWFYVEEGKLDINMNAFVWYDNYLFFVGAGRIMDEVSGLVQDPANPEDWYYLANGQVQMDYTGLAEYDGEWFYVEYGLFMNDYEGVVDYNNALFYVINGQIVNLTIDQGLCNRAMANYPYYAAQRQYVTDYINELRWYCEVPQLVLDEQLCVAASIRAQEMAEYQYHELDRPDGKKWNSIFVERGLYYESAGMNYQYGYDTVEQACYSLEEDGNQYENTIYENFGKIGVGVAQDAYGTMYYVQLFTD